MELKSFYSFTFLSALFANLDKNVAYYRVHIVHVTKGNANNNNNNNNKYMYMYTQRKNEPLVRTS